MGGRFAARDQSWTGCLTHRPSFLTLFLKYTKQHTPYLRLCFFQLVLWTKLFFFFFFGGKGEKCFMHRNAEGAVFFGLTFDC